MFIQKLINDSVSVSNHTKGKGKDINTGADCNCITITADDIKQCIKHNSSEYDFLQDIIDSNSHDTTHRPHGQNESKKNVNSVPNYSKIQAQIDKLTNTSSKDKSNQHDHINTNDSQNKVEITKKRRNKTNNNNEAKEKTHNKKLKTISSFMQNDSVDDINIDTYLQSQDLQTNNNGHRFGNDQIIEDDEDYDF